MPSQASHVSSTSEKQSARSAAPSRAPAAPGVAAAAPDMVQRAVADPAAVTPGEVAQLQRAAGNRAVSSLLARRAVQPKLTVGAADDAYEQEAERTADRVMRMPEPGTDAARPAVRRKTGDDEDEAVQAKPLAAGLTPVVRRQTEDEEEAVQPKRISPSAIALAQRHEEEAIDLRRSARDMRQSFEPGASFEDRLQTSGGGRPLPAETRSFMEPRFGADFSGVRLHTGSESAQLNQEISAQAFTRGRDVYLGASAPDVASGAGKRLLAHELTHVVQQGAAQPVRRAAVLHDHEVQRTPARIAAALASPSVRAPRIQRFVTRNQWEAYTNNFQRDDSTYIPVLDGLIGQYEAEVAKPQDEATRKERMRLLSEIEHGVYERFDTADNKGNDAFWRKPYYWLLDAVQAEHQKLIKEKMVSGGGLYTQDVLDPVATTELEQMWQALVNGTGSLKIKNMWTHPTHPEWTEVHPSFDVEMLAACARLMSRPYGRGLIRQAIGAIGAPRPENKQITVSPMQQGEVEEGRGLVGTARTDESKAKSTGGIANPEGSFTKSFMASPADTDYRVYDAAGNEILAPLFIILGHELIHALHNLGGTNAKETSYGKGHVKEKWINAEEEQAIAKENLLRQEHGMQTARHEHTRTYNPERMKQIAERGQENKKVFGSVLGGEILKLENFMPSTKSGMFDVELNPLTNQMRVIVKLHLNLQAVQTPARTEFGEDFPRYNEQWTRTEARAWRTQLQTNLQAVWNNKARFNLQKPGDLAPELQINPVFEIAASYSIQEPLKPTGATGQAPKNSLNTGQIGEGGAHYTSDVWHGSAGPQGSYARVKASNAFGQGTADRTKVASAPKTTAVDNAPITRHGMGQGPASRGKARLHREDNQFDNHNADRLRQITESERALLKALIGNDGFDINFKFQVRGIGPIGERSAERLDKFANDLKSIYPPLALGYPLVLKGTADKTWRVETHLRQHPIINKTFPRANNRFEHIVSKGQTKMYVKPDFMATAADNVGSQMTAAHEFGHMLGIPDDYVGLNRDGNNQAKDVFGKMANYSFNDGGNVDVNMNPDLHEKLKGVLPALSGGPEFTPEKQSSMIDLCAKAHVPVPTTFGLYHDTIMGSGDKFLPHHFVTVWDALTRMTARFTRPDWWKIEMR